MNNINLSVLTYNEEKRIDAFLKVASKYAKKIYLFDKSSTDSTVEIANRYGCIVNKIPFSLQGSEDVIAINDILRKYIENDNGWYLALTPGEIPTKGLVNYINSIIVNSEFQNVDVIFLPVRLFTFGKNRNWGPWKSTIQARLININLAQIQNIVHNTYKTTENSRVINDSDDINIFHPTHNDYSSFIKSHHDYAINEKFNCSFDERVQTALKFSNQFDYELFDNKIKDNDLRPLVAWKIYCLMTALYTMDQKFKDETTENINNAQDAYLLNWQN